MLVREYRQEDLLEIDKIWREHHSHLYSLPHRRNRLYEAVVEGDKGDVIGYGQVKAFAEAMMFLDLSLSNYKKAYAIKILIDRAIREISILGIRDLYVFSKDPDYSLLLEKKYKFERVDDPGELLLLTIRRAS